jgi:glycosyltransferase involved in cell wall biosynthesis
MNLKPCSLVFLCPNFPSRGGVESVTSLLVDFFLSRQYEVNILACIAVGLENTTENRHLDRTIFMPGTLNDGENLAFIDAYLKLNPVDVLFNQGVQSLIYLSAKNYPKTKIINTLHGKPFWETDAFRFYSLGQLLQNNQTVVAKTTTLVRYWMSRMHPDWAFPHLSSFYRKQIESVGKYVVLDDAFKSELEAKLYGGRVQSNIVVIKNPLAETQAPQLVKEKMVLFVGRLIRCSKRVDRLLHIWSRMETRHPDWTLVLVGDGEDKLDLQQLSEQLGLQRVRFEGFRDANAFYRRASILGLTSSWEGTPMVIPEAQQQGVVPVVYDCVSSMSNLIDSGVNGILVPAFDENAFVAALNRLMSEPTLLVEMAKNAPQKTQDRALEIIGMNWLKLFSEL